MWVAFQQLLHQQRRPVDATTHVGRSAVNHTRVSDGSAQRPQHSAQSRFFDQRIAPNPHAAGQLDLDRAFRLRLRRWCHGNPQKLQALSVFQPTLGLSPPMMKQVRMHIVPSRSRRHHRARPKALLYNPRLLGQRPPPPPLRT